MIDSAKSREIAFDYISKIENVNILNEKEKASIGFKTTLDIWQVNTEIFYENAIIEIELHVVFTSQFPLEFPKIFLTPDTFKRIKYIPHVGTNRLVCTYDSEIVSTNPEEPAGIVGECIRKSKSIILDGLSNNYSSDFEDEFKAYWEGMYGRERKSPQNILSLINNIQDKYCIKLLCLKQDIKGFKYVIHTCDETAVRFKKFIKKYSFDFDEVDVFYLKEFNQTEPPFDFSNKDIISIVKSKGKRYFDDFKAFINSSEFPKLVVCEKKYEEKSFLFGWFHKSIKTDVNGFRKGKFSKFSAISISQANERVERITTDVFTKERLENRTSGQELSESERSFLIAGTGSIGSNLIFFLNSFNSPQFKLIDTDVLIIPNIQRHLLGFQDVGSYKTKAIKEYILKNNPLQEVSTKESSIIDVINDDLSYINDADYLFITIGKANIDKVICQSLKKGIIKKPVFIIWVEPFLCGGHCLFLHPSDPDFENYFHENYFKFNVIDNSEYKSGSKKLSLREAGCQSTYIPYSGANVISFLSSLFPIISSIIDSNKSDSIAYSWLGNIVEVDRLGVDLSSYYDTNNIGDIIEHKL